MGPTVCGERMTTGVFLVTNSVLVWVGDPPPGCLTPGTDGTLLVEQADGGVMSTGSGVETLPFMVMVSSSVTVEVTVLVIVPLVCVTVFEH